METRRHRAPVLLVVAALTVTVAACGGDDSDATLPSLTTIAAPTSTDAPATAPPTTAEPVVTEAPTATELPTTTAAPTTTEAPTTTTEPPAPGACLVGEWMIEEAQLNAFYDQVEATSEGEISFQITGFTGLAFGDDGRYAYTPDFTLELEVIGAGGSGTAGGIIGGTYEVIDGIVRTTIDQDEFELTVNIMGQVFDGSEVAGGFLTSLPFAEAPFDCSGPSPVIDFSTGEGNPRVPMTLTPA